MQRHTKNESTNFRPKSSEEQKAKGRLADVQFSAQNQVNSKKRLSRPQALVSAETSQNFRVSMIRHVFTVQNAEKEDIWAFLTSSEDKLFLLKRRTYGKPISSGGREFADASSCKPDTHTVRMKACLHCA